MPYLSSCPSRQFPVLCASKGRTGHWKCENYGPEATTREEAREQAKASGWVEAGRNKWYCPECQRDGFVPAPKQLRSREMQTS